MTVSAVCQLDLAMALVFPSCMCLRDTVKGLCRCGPCPQTADLQERLSPTARAGQSVKEQK